MRGNNFAEKQHDSFNRSAQRAARWGKPLRHPKIPASADGAIQRSLRRAARWETAEKVALHMILNLDVGCFAAASLVGGF